MSSSHALNCHVTQLVPNCEFRTEARLIQSFRPLVAYVAIACRMAEESMAEESFEVAERTAKLEGGKENHTSL